MASNDTKTPSPPWGSELAEKMRDDTTAATPARQRPEPAGLDPAYRGHGPGAPAAAPAADNRLPLPPPPGGYGAYQRADARTPDYGPPESSYPPPSAAAGGGVGGPAGSAEFVMTPPPISAGVYDGSLAGFDGGASLKPQMVYPGSNSGGSGAGSGYGVPPAAPLVHHQASYLGASASAGSTYEPLQRAYSGACSGGSASAYGDPGSHRPGNNGYAHPPLPGFSGPGYGHGQAMAPPSGPYGNSMSSQGQPPLAAYPSNLSSVASSGSVVLASLRLELVGRSLPRMDLGGLRKGDPYVMIYRVRGAKKELLHKTEVIGKSCNPKWAPFTVSFKVFEGELKSDTRFEFVVMDEDTGKKDDVVGSVQGTLLELERQPTFLLVDEKKRKRNKDPSCGYLNVTSCSVEYFHKAS